MIYSSIQKVTVRINGPAFHKFGHRLINYEMNEQICYMKSGCFIHYLNYLLDINRNRRFSIAIMKVNH
jgi:hypothetical protein